MTHVLAIVAQFALSAALVISIRWRPFPIWMLIAAAPGAALAIAAWFGIGFRNIRIQPTVTEKTTLVTSGAYAVVRHPMYAGLLWFTAASLATPFAFERCLMWGCLLIVLDAKARTEEREMSHRFAEYEDYRSRTGRLFPKLIQRR
ncbi:hypothetical protein LOC67_21580 [Stieleria sp. JC731]|uniref:methyltransferase family protein n=1 Tax=Pirellulaceae TaxID=2691357 RepID=UPI001E2AA25E|nr:methyltransferase [Stieleria sp. JC731]MCC9603149.1 hypothetical protein [Stieleria sp. JC731]